MPKTARSSRLPLLGGALIRAALIAGARAVIAKRDVLNNINVFPVADKDTGSNMAFTFAAVLSSAQSARGLDASGVLSSAALSAIDGARGNSGAIVAQFFHGLAEALRGQVRVSLQNLSLAVSSAALSTRQAMAEPKEGTVLSVIADFARALTEAWDTLDVRGFFARGLQAARVALERTPKQLPILAKHGVVDAGGFGFVQFLEGVQAFVEQGRAALRRAAKSAEVILEWHDHSLSHAHEPDSLSNYRYCSECVLEHVDTDALRAALAQMSLDSVVLAGGASRAHLHAHTNTPAALFELAGQYGEVSQRKADDMHAQIRARENTAAVAVVCDTGADLPLAEAERLYVHKVPVRVNFGSDEFIDGVTLSAAQFYQRLRSEKTPVRTSQPPTGEFRRLFDQLASFHQDVLCLNISARLSGTFQAASSASKHGGDGRAQTFDTAHASTGEALLVLAAAEMAQSGATVAQIVAELERLRERTYTFAVIDDARYAARGGRLPAWLVPISRWLRVRIMVRAKLGKLRPAGLLWGNTGWTERYARWALARVPGKSLRVLIGHCDAQTQGEALQQALLKIAAARIARCDLVPAGTGIGAHAGPGTLVLGMQALED